MPYTSASENSKEITSKTHSITWDFSFPRTSHFDLIRFKSQVQQPSQFPTQRGDKLKSIPMKSRSCSATRPSYYLITRNSKLISINSNLQSKIKPLIELFSFPSKQPLNHTNKQSSKTVIPSQRQAHINETPPIINLSKLQKEIIKTLTQL